MLLLFDKKHQYLGETSLKENGSLKTIFLTVKGEQEIGATVSMWQTSGISLKQDVLANSETETEAFFVQRVQPRSGHFKEAFLSWAKKRKIAVVDLDAKLLPFWETLLRLPLTSSERFTYLVGISCMTEKKKEEWNSAFQTLHCDDSTEGKRALNKIKVKLAKEMTRSFCREKRIL